MESTYGNTDDDCCGCVLVYLFACMKYKIHPMTLCVCAYRVLTTMTIYAHLVIHTRVPRQLFIESTKDPVHVQRRRQEQQRRMLSL